MAILKDTLIQGACRVIGDAYMSLVTASGFKKDGSSDSYVLLGGGSHKAVSDFVLITSSNRLGVYRLYRRDDNSNYSVQTDWTGTYWRLRGYSADTYHAGCLVAYADSAGSATIATSLKYIGSSSNLDSGCTSNGIYAHANTATSSPTNSYGNLLNISNKDTCSPGTDGHWIQLLDFTHEGSIWHRQRINTGSWTAWEKILTTANWTGIIDGRYLLLSGGTMTGALTTPSITVTGASSFSLAINGSILGNAATASRLQNSRTITLSGAVTSSAVSFDGSGNITISTSVNHTHSYLPLAGGTMNDKAVISRSCTDAGISWYQGRLYPIIKTTSYTGYNSILSMKTTNGSWDLGVYSNDTAYLTYITDINYYNNANNTTYQLAFPKDTGTLALTKNVVSKSGDTMTGNLTVPSLTVTGIFKPSIIEVLMYESSGTNGGSGSDASSYITVNSTSATVNGFRIGTLYDGDYLLQISTSTPYTASWNYNERLFDRLMFSSTSQIALTYQVKLGGRRIIDVYRIQGGITNLWLINDPNDADATKNIIIDEFGTVSTLTKTNFTSKSFNSRNLTWSTFGTPASVTQFKAYIKSFNTTTPYLLRIIEGTNNIYIITVKLN